MPATDGVRDPACPAATNMLVTRPLRATLTVPARSTKSLSDLGIPQAQWPVLTMPDLPTNQDACEGATFTLLYLGTATAATRSLAPTWTALVSSPDPSSLGHAVLLTAIVTTSSGQGAPAGSISFYSGSPSGSHALLDTSSLKSGARATWSTSALGAGLDSLYAVYAGGTNFVASTSPVIFQIVITLRSIRAGTFDNAITASLASSPNVAPATTPIPAMSRSARSSCHGSPAAYDHDTSIGCTAVTS